MIWQVTGTGEGSQRVRVPGAAASIDEVISFAGTYNAYELVASEPARLERLVLPIYEDLAQSGRAPDWLGLDLARAVLFYAYRADRFAGGYGPYAPMRTLVEHIASISGGWVDQRDHSDTAEIRVRGSATAAEFVDSWEYSADKVYRWWYERRWAPGPTLCFVGLNPATGDTDGKARPTLNKVVGWAKRERCGAVVVVNLFAYRATDPARLFSASVDIVGARNDQVITEQSADAAVTLAAWGAHPLAVARARNVLPTLKQPLCVGVTKSGAPAHPLYIRASALLHPFMRLDVEPSPVLGATVPIVHDR